MSDFEAWYGEQYSRVLAACVALAADLEAAQEATDEAFVRAFERWAQVSAMAAPGGWAQTVALNQTRRILRRRRFERLLPGGRRTTVTVELHDERLWAEVRRLPPRQQTAVVLRYVQDLPEAAVAEAMGISRGAASASLAAARAKLRLSLGDPISEESRNG